MRADANGLWQGNGGENRGEEVKGRIGEGENRGEEVKGRIGEGENR